MTTTLAYTLVLAVLFLLKKLPSRQMPDGVKQGRRSRGVEELRS